MITASIIALLNNENNSYGESLMVVLTLFAGAALGAIAGLALGDMVKVSIAGEIANLRYVFMLLGTLIGYGVARLLTRSHNDQGHDQRHELN